MPVFTLPAIPVAIVEALAMVGITVGGPTMVTSSQPGIAPVEAQQDYASVSSQSFEGAINQHRQNLGLAPLAVDPSLVSRSEAWSAHQAQTATCDHEPVPGFEVVQSIPNWEGPSVDQFVSRWLGSPAHREIIENPEITRIGAGTAANGTLTYATVKFAY